MNILCLRFSIKYRYIRDVREAICCLIYIVYFLLWSVLLTVVRKTQTELASIIQFYDQFSELRGPNFLYLEGADKSTRFT